MAAAPPVTNPTSLSAAASKNPATRNKAYRKPKVNPKPSSEWPIISAITICHYYFYCICILGIVSRTVISLTTTTITITTVTSIVTIIKRF